MKITEYLKLSKQIKELKTKQLKIRENIKNELIANSPFKIGDIIKGKEYTDRIRVVLIEKFDVSILEDKVTLIAIGETRTLSGYSDTRNKWNKRKIYIDDNSTKVKND